MNVLAIKTIFDLGRVALEKIFPDPTQRAEQMFRLEELRQKGNLAELSAHVNLLTSQMRINEVEAEHPSLFIAGWRPMVGWTGAAALAYVSIIDPFLRFCASVMGYEGAFPVIDSALTMQVLLGILGIGGMRSFDKFKGTDTKQIKDR